MQEARRPGKRPDQEARREPHQSHARAEQQHETLALCPEILARQLDARNDQLDAEDQPREVERDDAQARIDTVGIADCGRAASSIAIRPNEVGPMRAEGNANEEGDDCSAARLAGYAREIRLAAKTKAASTRQGGETWPLISEIAAAMFLPLHDAKTKSTVKDIKKDLRASDR